MTIADSRAAFTGEQLADLASKATDKANAEAARRYKAGPEREACAQFLAGVYYSEYVNPPKLTPAQKIAALTKERNALQSRLDSAEAEVTRLTQLVSGGKGGLPEGAVAWLDMGKGEASITFNKKRDSNRASKRNAMELFNRVPAGYYPLYLSPQNGELRSAALGGESRGNEEVRK